MGFVNKNYPPKAGSAPQRGNKEEKNELSAFMFLQKVAAFAGRVHTKDNNHRY
jgi:hypothetical protein